MKVTANPSKMFYQKHTTAIIPLFLISLFRRHVYFLIFNSRYKSKKNSPRLHKSTVYLLLQWTNLGKLRVKTFWGNWSSINSWRLFPAIWYQYDFNVVKHPLDAVCFFKSTKKMALKQSFFSQLFYAGFYDFMKIIRLIGWLSYLLL